MANRFNSWQGSLQKKARGINTSTRLILSLIAMIGLVMIVAGYYMLRQRQAILTTALQNEVRAHAVTLQLVLEDDYRAGRISDAQRFINRLSENPKIHSVILFDEKGNIAMLSDPLVPDKIRYPAEVKQVLATEKPFETVRRIGKQKVFSIITPIRISPTRRAAFEITQPHSFVEADFARARRDIGLLTLILFMIVSLVVLIVTRRNLSRPIGELLTGAEALGKGDLQYRVIVPDGGGEFLRLAQSFNRMAERLENQRRASAREAEERLALERELRHSERLASVGRLAAGVAHEMGAPLNVIKGRAEQLVERLDAPIDSSIELMWDGLRQKLRRNLTIITEQADGIARIVRQLLNLARPFNLHRAPVEISRAIARVTELIGAEAAKAGIMVEVAPCSGLAVEADAELLHQVLMNICLNSLQAMPDGGRLRIEAAASDISRGGRPCIQVRVSDTGPGIRPDHLPHIFDPFFTTKEVGQGTGLGLAVSRRIVEEHDGWMEAVNLESGGAAFTIGLSAVQPASAPDHTSTKIGGEK